MSTLRQEVTAVLRNVVVKRGDEVVLVLNTGGGTVTGYGLAAAQVREVQALVDYNISIARLFETMGIGLRMNQIELVEVDSGEALIR